MPTDNQDNRDRSQYIQLEISRIARFSFSHENVRHLGAQCRATRLARSHQNQQCTLKWATGSPSDPESPADLFHRLTGFSFLHDGDILALSVLRLRHGSSWPDSAKNLDPRAVCFLGKLTALTDYFASDFFLLRVQYQSRGALLLYGGLDGKIPLTLCLYVVRGYDAYRRRRLFQECRSSFLGRYL